MKTKVLVRQGSKDAFAEFDTEIGKLVDSAGNDIDFDGIYAITPDGKFGVISDKDKVEEYLETYRIISD